MMAESEFALPRSKGRTLVVGVGLVVLFLAIGALGDKFDWLVAYPPSFELPTRAWIGGAMDWLVKDCDLGLFTFQELTRSIAWLLSWPFTFVNAVLWKGFSVGGWLAVPPLSWAVVCLLTSALGWWIKGWRLAALGFGSVGFLVLFGYWDSAMKTLSSIVMVVPIGCVLGTYVGIVSYRHPKLRPIITPMLDFMQTVPIFAYLLPVLFLFGFGPLSAMMATLIYAMPPMVRATLLGLQTVPTEVQESGVMAGCTRRQLTWQVLIPSSKHALLVGLNQVIMLSLNAVIIASLIGAGGLGYDVMRALKALRIGQGLEAGTAIVVLAILLDRYSRAFVDRGPDLAAPPSGSFLRRHSFLLPVLGVAIVIQLLAYWVPWLQAFPKAEAMTTAPLWDALVDRIVVDYYQPLAAFKDALLLYVLLPTKNLLLSLPWSSVILTLTIVGYLLGGRSLALQVGLLALFILVSGFWEKAMITVYLIGISVILAFLVGFPLGVWASTSERLSRVFGVIADTLQTLPSFVYLIPVVMLFEAGDVSALLSVVAYAIAPVVRYTDNGLRHVPPHLVEVARSVGCNRWQVFSQVKRILAFPEILLGINQTIMLAISMLVITALVGTRDLGQEVYIGLARTDTGRGLVAGFCVAFIAIIVDRLLQAYAREQKARLGLD